MVVKVAPFRSYLAAGMRSVSGADELLGVAVVRPASMGSNPSVTRTRWTPADAAPPFGGLTLYAGRPDLADDSHFTIAYAIPAGKGTIDGWLLSDDMVKFEVRDGPMAPSVPAGRPYNGSQ